MNAITCDDLVFRRGDRTVLNRIGFELAPGRLLGLIGHNGAGKSTLIKLILGLLKPASGRLEVLGGAPGASPLDVGYLPENVSFYDAMTVEEHLRYFAGLKGVARPRIDELVEELGLGVVLRQRLGQCSKGQRQRLVPHVPRALRASRRGLRRRRLHARACARRTLSRPGAASGHRRVPRQRHA